MCFRESMSFLNSHYVHKGRGIPFFLIVRLFLKCLLEDKQFMDHNIWKDVNIDHAVQTDICEICEITNVIFFYVILNLYF